jgi:hypothetical protein
MIAEGNINVGQIIPLDGMNLSKSEFRDTTFVYGGGAYRLVNSLFVGNTEFRFIGAANNTLQLLAQFGFIGCPAKPQPPAVNPNTPAIKTASLAEPLKMDLIAPYQGK